MYERFETKVCVAYHAFSKVHSCIIKLKISMSCMSLSPFSAGSPHRSTELNSCKPEEKWQVCMMHHKDASAPRMKKDENDDHKAMHTIERAG